MNPAHTADLKTTAMSLFQTSHGLFWQILPIALLLAMLVIYVSGEISGAKLESLFRRVLIAIAALVAFPQISQAIQGMEGYLVSAFGGEDSLSILFTKLADRAHEVKESGALNWLQVGQIGLNLITVLSFFILALIRHFLDVLHLTIWNLLNILAPLALLGCLFQSWVQVPKGIFTGLLELALWKPLWVILARLLLAAGFGETPQDVSQWFDTAILNFAVAGLMASTPLLVHAFLGGTLGSMGGSVIQTMITGAGAAMTAQPMRAVQTGSRTLSNAISGGFKSALPGQSPAKSPPPSPPASRPNPNKFSRKE